MAQIQFPLIKSSTIGRFMELTQNLTPEQKDELSNLIFTTSGDIPSALMARKLRLDMFDPLLFHEELSRDPEAFSKLSWIDVHYCKKESQEEYCRRIVRRAWPFAKAATLVGVTGNVEKILKTWNANCEPEDQTNYLNHLPQFSDYAANTKV
jgi:hypothetical protein